jgi:hypothetical protein
VFGVGLLGPYRRDRVRRSHDERTAVNAGGVFGPTDRIGVPETSNRSAVSRTRQTTMTSLLKFDFWRATASVMFKF